MTRGEVVGLMGREAGHADGRERGPEVGGTGWVRKRVRRLFQDTSSGAVVFKVRSRAGTQILGNVG